MTDNVKEFVKPAGKCSGCGSDEKFCKECKRGFCPKLNACPSCMPHIALGLKAIEGQGKAFNALVTVATLLLVFGPPFAFSFWGANPVLSSILWFLFMAALPRVVKL